jgi:hypothetical protein
MPPFVGNSPAALSEFWSAPGPEGEVHIAPQLGASSTPVLENTRAEPEKPLPPPPGMSGCE